MFKPSVLVIAILATGMAARALAAEPGGEHWDRRQALQAAASVDTSVHRQRLRSDLRSGDNSATLRSLRQLARAPELPAPAREKLLYEYVSDLRQEPPSAVSREVLGFLQAYASTVLVESEDHPRNFVPLFNISTAAFGVQNVWKRQEASYRGSVLLVKGPQHLVEAYLQTSDLPERAGLTDVLSHANPLELQALSELTAELVSSRPDVFALATETALRAMHTGALQQLVAQADNPEIVHLLQRSAKVLNRQQTSQLLKAALETGTTTTASLALAILSPALAGDAQLETLLVEKLADPDLGSTAAITLARTASPQTLLQLHDLAKPANQTAQAYRARMALQIRETQSNSGTGQ